jgi:hypothetical protein
MLSIRSSLILLALIAAAFQIHLGTQWVDRNARGTKEDSVGDWAGDSGTDKSIRQVRRMTATSSKSPGLLFKNPLSLAQNQSNRKANEARDRHGTDGKRVTPNAGRANSSTPEAFGACLLIMDDNHWLIEWLSYHYHALPLRHIVLVRDPRSRTSPHPVLDRWTSPVVKKNHTENSRPQITIVEWTDDDVLPAWIRKSFAANLVQLHRKRQQFFYARCLRYYHDLYHRSTQHTSNTRVGKMQLRYPWVLLTDSDEFIRPNPFIPPPLTKSLSPSLSWLEENNQRIHSATGNHIQSAARPGPLAESGTVLRVIHQYENDRRQNNKGLPSCLHVPRIQIATKDVPSTNSHVLGVVKSVTSQCALNAYEMLTTRWLYHNGREIIGPKHLDGKNIVNVARLPSGRSIPAKVPNVHRVIADEKICPNTAGNRLTHDDSWLSIYHYAGTFEQYTFRSDPRDQIETRPKRADPTVWRNLGQGAGKSSQPATIQNDTLEMLSWLTGFVADVGEKEARRLLHSVGKLG